MEGDEDRGSHGCALTMSELQQLAMNQLIEVGAHSLTHPSLAARPASEQRAEIEESKAFLENLLQRPVTGFSYPHGSLSSLTRDLVCQAGYRYACASHNDVVRCGSDPFRLPRFWVPDWNGERFGRWLQWWLPG
jgi:peptidoglycan/xylan/chitin deacetylase (PgdA/CDA1 family)